MRSSHKRPKVLIAFPSSRNSRYEKMGGIYRYLREHGLAWEFVIMHEYVKLSRNYLSTLVEEGLDGAIFTAVDIPHDVIEHMSEIRLPVVTIALPIPERPNVSFVLSDNAAHARLAVGEFLRSGRFRTYAYVPLPEAPDWCNTHIRVMADALSKHGHELKVFAAPIAKDRTHLVHWLRQLPKPAAILAACDYRANDVLQAARKARTDIPGDLEVMGIDNDTTLCENSTPTLTSIQPDFEQQGYLSAKLLDELLSGSSATKRESVGAKSIAWRESAISTHATGASLVQRAIDFINREYANGIGVREVVAYLKVSRPLADLRFRQCHDKTILETITNIRLKKTRELLSSSPHLTISEICRQAGWKSESHPKHLFRKHYGITMSDDRLG
ncbi:MAG: substrate-binding domain-containing protein [Kiritimatiellia bacterium]